MGDAGKPADKERDVLGCHSIMERSIRDNAS
jgi:hypothetical protein